MERADLSGTILDGRYRVIEPVAEGAMGVVYRAERLKLGRIVAIKMLHDVLPDELSGRKRFEIEAMAMAKLEHPHCASVLDVGVHNERPFVVMDFVSGQNLKELIAAGPVPVLRAADLVRQVLSGLAHAHEHGVIHRDIKPANLVLSHKTGLGDHIKILDFGLARLHDTGQNLTSGIAVGTPAYMAPEQIRGQPIDFRADLYACGVLLFELLTGKKPYHSEKDDPIEVCKMHLSEPIPRLDSALPGVDFGELEAVVAKALAKRASKRFASAQDFARAIDAAVDPIARRAPRQAPRAPVGPAALAAAAADLEVRTGDVISSAPASPPDVAHRGFVDPRGRPSTPSSVAVAGRASTLPDPRPPALTSPVPVAGEPRGALSSPPPRGTTPPAGAAAVAANPLAANPRARTPPGDPRAASPRAATPSGGAVVAGTPSGGASHAGRPATPRPGDPTEVLPAEAAGTFLGIAVPRAAVSPAQLAAATSAARGAMETPATGARTVPPVQSPAPRARRRRHRLAAIAGAAVIVSAAIGMAIHLSRDPAPEPPTSAAPAAPGAGSAGETSQAIIARANEIAARGDKEAALELLNRSRRQSPTSAPLAYAAGRIYFSKLYWTDGLKSFRDAIRNDARYRRDPELIKTVLRGFLVTPSYNEELASFLRDDIGGAVQPMLEETVRDHPSPNVRARAASELRRYR